jgi:hypothetical protein
MFAAAASAPPPPRHSWRRLAQARSMLGGATRLYESVWQYESLHNAIIEVPTLARHGCFMTDRSPRIAAPLVHAHVGPLQPIYQRFLLGSDLCGKRRRDSFVEHEQLVDRHWIKVALLHESFRSWTAIVIDDDHE